MQLSYPVFFFLSEHFILQFITAFPLHSTSGWWINLGKLKHAIYNPAYLISF